MPAEKNGSRWVAPIAWLLLLLLIFAVAGSPPPAVNEAHYLLKAKQFWQPDWLDHDLFVSSGKAHAAFYAAFGWLHLLFDFAAVAWVARLAGWSLLAFGLVRLGSALFRSSSSPTAPTRRVLWGPLLMLPVAVIWISGLERANLAGEWVVGGIEAKVIAYGFLLCGLTALTAGRWARVWPWFGLASAFHVLVGGWAVVGAMLVRLLELRSDRGSRHRGQTDLADREATDDSGAAARAPSAPFSLWELGGLFLGGAIALIGLVPALRLSVGVPAEDVALAARNYAYGRLAHHLTPSTFPWHWYLRHGVLLVTTTVAAVGLLRRLPCSLRPRYRRLLGFLATGPLIALCGLVVGTVPAWDPDWGARLLRFYWFRMTDAYVPLAAGIVVVAWLAVVPRHAATAIWRWAAAGVLALALLLLAIDAGLQLTSGLPRGVAMAHDLKQPGLEPTAAGRQQVYHDWRAVCRFIRQQTPTDATFITPRAQQTFKWYARRAEVVNWKDVPQDVPSLLEWGRRVNRVFPRRLWRRHPPMQLDELTQLARRYDAQFLLVDRRVADPPPGLPRLYPRGDQQNATYALYQLPQSPESLPAG